MCDKVYTPGSVNVHIMVDDLILWGYIMIILNIEFEMSDYYPRWFKERMSILHRVHPMSWSMQKLFHFHFHLAGKIIQSLSSWEIIFHSLTGWDIALNSSAMYIQLGGICHTFQLFSGCIMTFGKKIKSEHSLPEGVLPGKNMYSY